MYKFNNCFICCSLTLITKTQMLGYTLNFDWAPSYTGLRGSKFDGRAEKRCSSVDCCWNRHCPSRPNHTLQLIRRDLDPLCSTRSRRSPSWNKFSTPCMYSLTKWFGDTSDLGIHMSPSLGTLHCLSASSGATLRKVRGEVEAVLKFWGPCPRPCSICNSHPDSCTGVESTVGHFHSDVPYPSLVRVYTYNSNYAKTQKS
jgi:hypothetical protein